MAIFDTIKAALGQFKDELKKLRRDIEELQQARENLIAQPAARADVVALLHGWLDVEHEQLVEYLGQRLQNDIARPKLDMTSPESVRRLTASNYLGLVPASAGGSATAQGVDMVLVGLLGGAIKSGLATIVDQLPWPGEPGLPMTERNKRVIQIDKQLDALKAKEADLVQAAQSARITVD